jgi:hypothetical protein
MRVELAAIILAGGCGAVYLGEEGSDSDAALLDAGLLGNDAGLLGDDAGLLGDDAGLLGDDAGLPADLAQQVRVEVVVRAEGGCDGCFQLTATGGGGPSPYSFQWEDGSQGAERRVCTAATPATLSVVARDAQGVASAPFVARLEAAGDSCAPAAHALCIENPSFEGTPAVNFGNPGEFDCAPWSDCTNPGAANTPDVLMSGSFQELFVAILPASDGSTYLGLNAAEQEQATQELCAALSGGTTVSLQLDLSRLPVGLVPGAERLFVEIWGGVAADCSARELLWASDGLDEGWRTYCVTLQPQSFTDSLTLRARSSESLSVDYVIVDNLRPVSACP